MESQQNSIYNAKNTRRKGGFSEKFENLTKCEDRI